jgi:hypothetical protein
VNAVKNVGALIGHDASGVIAVAAPVIEAVRIDRTMRGRPLPMLPKPERLALKITRYRDLQKQTNYASNRHAGGAALPHSDPSRRQQRLGRGSQEIALAFVHGNAITRYELCQPRAQDRESISARDRDSSLLGVPMIFWQRAFWRLLILEVTTMTCLRLPSSFSMFLLLATTPAWAQKHATSVTNLRFLGTHILTPGFSSGTLPPGFQVTQGPDEDAAAEIPGVSGNNSPARLPAAHVPTPAGNPIATGAFFSIPGLRQFDQAVAFTGSSNGFNGQLEPPDQGLSVGGGLVVEAVNNAIQFFLTNGTPLLPAAIAMNALYNVPPTFTVDPKTGQTVSFGPRLTDPRVYYDANNEFFLITELEIDIDPATGAFGPGSHVLIAVIPNNLSAINVFSLDVTNDGIACPCFGDQPLIGADANGFYISTNAFNIVARTFQGAQVYAIPLAALETGPPGSITAVHFGDLTQEGVPAFAIQPSTVPPGGAFETGQNGTEYLVSSFLSTLDNRLEVWALTNTASLNSATPSLSLVNTMIGTESYGLPPATDQKSGPTPLLDLIASRQSPFGVFKNHLELVTDNQDRLQQVVFAAGNLWTTVPTIVKTQGPVRAGAAWFILTPSIGPAQVIASVLNQGYLAIDSPHQNSVMFPAIGVNAAGRGAIAFSIVGEDFFPSAAYSLIDAVNGAGPIVISGPGVAPDDGFSGYAPFATRGTARWGDYSAAVSDEFGNIWMGTEMIPVNPPLILAGNWGTFITAVVP